MTTPDYNISRAAEDKLTYKLGLAAGRKCADLIAAYNECINGLTVSAVWKCKSAYNASQTCLRVYVNKENIETMKRRWVDAGKPQFPDWDQLMAGLVAPEHVVRQKKQQQQQQQEEQ